MSLLWIWGPELKLRLHLGNSVMYIKHRVKVYFKVFNNETTKNYLPSHCMLRNKKNKSEILPQGFCNCVSALMMTTAIKKQMAN